MREIRFRGKRLDNGKWVEGSLYLYSEDVWIDAEYDFPSIDPWVRVEPTTVGQYTGLRDKTGKRIFEGDIIQIPDDYDEFGHNAGEIYAIYFAYGGFRLKPKYNKAARGFWLEDDFTVEIIGNIHDNPELLEGKDGKQ